MADNAPNIGKLIEGDARRDAIHVAVAPVVAGHRLLPGYHVGFLPDGTVGDVDHDQTIGVVDPFLEHWVDPGDKFWLFLYPNTITSLRHIWSHPAFKPKPLSEL